MEELTEEEKIRQIDLNVDKAKQSITLGITSKKTKKIHQVDSMDELTNNRKNAPSFSTADMDLYTNVKFLALRRKNVQMQNDFYMKYFNLKREGAVALIGPPPYKWRDIKRNENKPQIYEAYSKMNVLLVGNFMQELLFLKEGVRADVNLIIIKSLNHIYVDGLLSPAYTFVPYLIVGNDSIDNDFLDQCTSHHGSKTTSNIIIKLNDYRKNKGQEYVIEGTSYSSKKVYYSKNDYLIGNRGLCLNENERSQNELSFNNKGHECIRNLILSIAAYQRNNNINQLPDDELEKVFKKMYKKNN